MIIIALKKKKKKKITPSSINDVCTNDIAHEIAFVVVGCVTTLRPIAGECVAADSADFSDG